MTNKDKIKAFINENAKYKVGRTVYFFDHGKICMATITGISIDCCYWDFVYYGGKWDTPLGRESKLYGSLDGARNARCAELGSELGRLSSVTEDDVVLWSDCEDELEDECEEGPGRD